MAEERLNSQVYVHVAIQMSRSLGARVPGDGPTGRQLRSCGARSKPCVWVRLETCTSYLESLRPMTRSGTRPVRS